MEKCRACKGNGNIQSKPLTFGELKLGEKFIFFPLDGDDSGHGGFRGACYVFEKIEPTKNDMWKEGVCDNARNVKRGVISTMPKHMTVIKIDC